MTIGVIGAGVMGAGLAQNLAETGHPVVLVDIKEEALERAKQEIKQAIRFRKLLRKDAALRDSGEILERIRFTTDKSDLAGSEFIVENVTEKLEVKRKVYQEIDSICDQSTIFAANTSAIPITRIAAVTDRPSQVIGIHFMNPVPLKTTVEVIPGYHTSSQTIEATKNLLAGMGKECVVVNDSPGFVSNRVLMLTINEAIFLLHERVAEAEQIDKIFRECFSHKMGPLETADLIGLDTILFSIEALYSEFRDSKFRPCPLLQKMVDAGRLGRKNGRGFYHYSDSFEYQFKDEAR